MAKAMSGSEIRQSFLDFFADKYKHTVVPSSPLVPAKDATLLFTNSGMVQFVDVFLGTGTRKYSRAVNSQKCLRVAGKHNDLEDVGTDDTHHTFFEMLGSWSFGDYYKKEAIAWGWELLTEVWGLPKDRLYASVFRDEKGEIPTDEEAASEWLAQPGFKADHLAYLGRKFNFWEMADTGPCGPNSEIHIDLGEAYGELTYLEDGQIDLDGPRFVELWNLVFIQYNRTGPKDLDPLPQKHVDTGMGFERIVSVMQGVDSNYKTDLFASIMEKIRALAGHSPKQMEKHYTPYRVIADHCRAASFLIADGVVPGNMGRNYVTRMIIRRAARFGAKIGLDEPFMADVARAVIDEYGAAYSELQKSADSIIENLTLEEQRFQRTLEGGLYKLDELLANLKESKKNILDGPESFELYATYGLPLEITRDILREQGLEVDEDGFAQSMEAHRNASGAGQALAEIGGKEAELYADILIQLQKEKKIGSEGVAYDPYSALNARGDVLALVSDGNRVKSAKQGETTALLLPETAFYIASGGQVSDIGWIRSADSDDWSFRVTEVIRPAAGVVVHLGKVESGEIKVGDAAEAQVDGRRRQDIIRNHTATHLLHAALHQVLGEGAKQAGSLVAPDRLRFDFNHNQALSSTEIIQIEEKVNAWILENLALNIQIKPLEQAKKEGAIALFGEKYSEEVRTITIGKGKPFSYELCGGTHVENTGEIGNFVITSEGSAAAGIRRIEAITGRAANENLLNLRKISKQAADNLGVQVSDLAEKSQSLKAELKQLKKQVQSQQSGKAEGKFLEMLEKAEKIEGISVLSARFEGLGSDTLRKLADKFREQTESGVLLLAGVQDENAALIAAITKDLNARGLKAGDLVKEIASMIGGSGGGRPDLAQAGGKELQNLDHALDQVKIWVQEHLK